MAGKDLKGSPSELEFKGESVGVKGNPGKDIKISDLSELKQQRVVLGVGICRPNPADQWVNPFAAQFCEVEVNMKTGEVKVLRFLETNDSGRVMNRMTFECQVCGGIATGIGLALTEARVLDGNQTRKMVDRNWHDYAVANGSQHNRLPYDTMRSRECDPGDSFLKSTDDRLYQIV